MDFLYEHGLDSRLFCFVNSYAFMYTIHNSIVIMLPNSKSIQNRMAQHYAFETIHSHGCKIYDEFGYKFQRSN